jgi:hypothetical protein
MTDTLSGLRSIKKEEEMRHLTKISRIPLAETDYLMCDTGMFGVSA